MQKGPEKIRLAPGKKIYFASDMHLGVPDYEQSLLREKKLVNWLEQIRNDAAYIFLLGDVFDFWFEYRHVVPKGYVRLLGKLAEISDSGIPILFFTGNHDLWTFGYLEKETGLRIHREPLYFECNGHFFYTGHGDGLGPGDKGYKFIKKVFSAPFSQWLFKLIHPDLGIAMANFWSGESRSKNLGTDEVFKGEEGEWLFQFCREFSQTHKVNYFLFGHRHLFLDLEVGEHCRYINLGHWFTQPVSLIFDGTKLLISNI